MQRGYRRGSADQTYHVPMAQVTVFVDDAVRGTLPAVCVKDGVGTSSQMVVQDELGDRSGLGVAWLLLLLGPLGWIGLLVMLVARGGRGEVLTVQLPMSDAAHDRLRMARRGRMLAALVAVVAGLVALFAATSSSGADGGAVSARALTLVAIVVLVGAVVALLVADRRATSSTVRIDLDASRRWVTLTRVHPSFVAACQAHESRQSHRA